MFTYKVTTTGNGDLYTYNKFNDKGEVVDADVLKQTFHSEADAEKFIRTIATTNDIVEVSDIKNVNTDANTNVDLVSPSDISDRYHGMRPISEEASVEGQIDAEKTAQVEEQATKAQEKADARTAKARKDGEDEEVTLSSATTQAIQEVQYPLPSPAREAKEVEQARTEGTKGKKGSK